MIMSIPASIGVYPVGAVSATIPPGIISIARARRRSYKSPLTHAVTVRQQ